MNTDTMEMDMVDTGDTSRRNNKGCDTPMNKKILFLSILFIILVSALVSYTYYNQTINQNTSQTGSGSTISATTLNNEIDSGLLDENQGVQIGEMV